MRCRREIDKRKTKGGGRRSEAAQSEPPRDGTRTGRSASAAETAEALGTSARTVERLRTIDDHGTPEVIAMAT